MKFTFAFFGTLAAGIFIVWCGGYNFDARNFDVAFGAVTILAASVFAAVLTRK